jgi:hypothetical protein
MKMKVIECDYGNPTPHRKFQTEDMLTTHGFSSIRRGKSMLRHMEADGLVDHWEVAAAEVELAACGLPEKPPPIPEQALLELALKLTDPGISRRTVEKKIRKHLVEGYISDADAGRLREYAKNPEALLEAVKFDSTVQALRGVKPEHREEIILGLIGCGDIDEQLAARIGEQAKTLPYEPDPVQQFVYAFLEELERSIAEDIAGKSGQA